MTEKEGYGAAREALRKSRDHPDRHAEHEEHLLRYLQGVAYHDEREEARERETRSAGPAGPTGSQTWFVKTTVYHFDRQRFHAEARLIRGGSPLTGEGAARRGEFDETAPEAGAVLAAARAFADLSRRMREPVAGQVERPNQGDDHS